MKKIIQTSRKLTHSRLIVFFCDILVSESICYRTRGNRLINKSNMTRRLKKIERVFGPNVTTRLNLSLKFFLKIFIILILHNIGSIKKKYFCHHYKYNWTYSFTWSPSNFFQPSGCIIVVMLSYDSRPTEIRGQYDFKAEEKMGRNSKHTIVPLSSLFNNMISQSMLCQDNSKNSGFSFTTRGFSLPKDNMTHISTKFFSAI